MNIGRTRRISQVSYIGIVAPVESSGNKSAGSFSDALRKQLREHYRSRASALFDELSEKAVNIVDHADIVEFERYRKLLGELINEMISGAYSIYSERTLDLSGKQNVYVIVKTMDSKLESLAADILERNSGHIDYLRRVDEIRGLIMDTLL